MKIAVTGATGFIGAYLIESLLDQAQHKVVAISRSVMTSEHPSVECRQADLFSLLDCENALEGCDVGIYLVHSMSPSERLSQGNFKDFDFLLADNFAKAAKKNKLKRIIYVSGLIPDSGDLSEHLASRLEVERTLSQKGIQTLTLRCGIVIGEGGSSFQMVKNLVHRLPFIALPVWTQSYTQAVYIRDLVSLLSKLVDWTGSETRSFDVGSNQSLPYSELLRITATELKTNNRFFSLPFIPRSLSKLWVQLITGQPANLVYPLVDSLVHPMLVSPERRPPSELMGALVEPEEAIRKSLFKDKWPQVPLRREISCSEKYSLVRSVQRLPQPAGWTMKDVAQYYIQWLPRFLWPYIVTSIEGSDVQFRLRFIRVPMLKLTLSEDRTFSGRQLFYITGGFLSVGGTRGRLEFRLSPEKNFFIAAIHNFQPRLPWYIYRYTQAILHAFVMKSFGKRLQKLSKL